VPSFPAVFVTFSAVCISFAMLGMSISPINALVRFLMPFDSFSASLAGRIGRLGGFIFFQSILTICGTFAVVFMLILTLGCASRSYRIFFCLIVSTAVCSWASSILSHHTSENARMADGP